MTEEEGATKRSRLWSHLERPTDSKGRRRARGRAVVKGHTVAKWNRALHLFDAPSDTAHLRLPRPSAAVFAAHLRWAPTRMTSAHPRDMADVDDVPSNALAPPPPSSLSSLRTPRVAPRSSSLGVAAASAVDAGAGKEAETSAPPRVAEGDEAISSLSAVEPDAARAAAGGATDSARQRQRQRPRADSNLSDRSSTSSVTSVAESEAGTGLSSGAGPSRSRTSTIRRRVGTSGPATDDDDAGAMTAQPAAARDKEMLVPERIDSLGAQLLLQEDTASDALLPLSATSSSGLPAPRPSQYFLGHASKRDDSHGSIEFLQSSSSGSSEDVTLSFAPVRLEEPVPAAGAKGLQGDAEAPRRTSENAERDGPKDAVLGDVSTNPRRVGKAGSRFIEVSRFDGTGSSGGD